MAQSPDSASASGADTERYRQGWKALSELIGQGRSFSGYEQNTCFLNTRNGSFADVSATTGLDLADDGRAVAVCDWDFDGRQDIWVTNRTAPRLRLLHNGGDGLPPPAWISLRLEGTTSNHDAIGARVVINGRQTKSLHAGDGFLSQSSKWLHFGLGDIENIDTLTIHWPGGADETITDLAPNQFYKITQGSGSAVAWKPPPTRPKLTPAVLAKPATGSATRTWLIGRIPLPFRIEADGPQLLNLWSKTCRPCVQEMQEWTANAEKIRAAGLDIIGLNVDALVGDALAVPPAGFPFRSLPATPEIIESLELFHRTFIELQQALPVPSSFLLDRGGNVAAIYKGRVELDRLLEDVAMLDAPVEAQRSGAVPYPGRWASEPFPPQPLRYANALAAAGKPELRLRYLRDFPTGTAAPPAFHRQAGIELLQGNHLVEARQHLIAALPGYQDDPAFRFNLGLAEAANRNAAGALENFNAVIRLDPSDAAAHFQLGNILQATGHSREAIPHYRESIRLKPGWAFPTNNLAWLLASDPELRDGAAALTLALELTNADGGNNPATLSTLAAAHAAKGDFAAAESAINRAIEIATSAGDAASAARFKLALQRYRSGDL